MLDPHTYKKLAKCIIFDECWDRLDIVTRMKTNTNFIIRAIHRKNFDNAQEYKQDFNEAYTIANEAWVTAQKKFVENGLMFSNVSYIKIMLEKEPWLIDEFKIEEKRLLKFYSGFDLSKHLYRSMKIHNEVARQLDAAVAQYTYRKTKEQT